ncbi:MAG TPA: universal stress protein, partial [Dehalococcoidia bacterium]|nr:universal stress protein [Dehalococcoidia bacterium]
RRILMPVNGLEYTLKAADVAAYLAKALDAELVLLTILRGRVQGRHELLRDGAALLNEAGFRTGRLDVRVHRRVGVGEDVASAILGELRRDGYDLLVLGAVDRSGDNRLYLGESVQTVLTASDLPTVLLVSHERPAGQVAAA